MANLLIDKHKLLYHEKELKSALAGESIVPIYVDLGIHNACNFRCVHCGPGFRGHGGYYIEREPLLNLSIPGCEYATGSLGHAIGVGAGMALSGKIDHEDYKTFVLVGDGECSDMR